MTEEVAVEALVIGLREAVVLVAIDVAEVAASETTDEAVAEGLVTIDEAVVVLAMIEGVGVAMVRTEEVVEGLAETAGVATRLRVCPSDPSTSETLSLLAPPPLPLPLALRLPTPLRPLQRRLPRTSGRPCSQSLLVARLAGVTVIVARATAGEAEATVIGIRLVAALVAIEAEAMVTGEEEAMATGVGTAVGLRAACPRAWLKTRGSATSSAKALPPHRSPQ